jgi:HlyD family secretion protein
MRAFEARTDSPRPGAPPHILLPPLRPPPAEPREATRPAVARPRWRRRMVVASAALALMIVGAALWSGRRAAAPAYVTAPVDRGDVVRFATASGMVNPVETVQIGSYVSGRILDLSCDYNSRVTKGQSCAKIDPRGYEASVEQAAAAVATAKAQAAKDRANLDYLKHVYDRNLDLSQRGVVAQDAIENAQNAYRQAQAQTDLDDAMIRQREAELKTAQVNLDYTDIISPVEGTVVSRSVAVGQTVTANFQTPTLFLIATDLTRMQVDATVTEAAIGDVREGQKVTFTVEAFPERTFDATVTQVRQAPISVQNVISYDVVVSADNPELVLKPGMTATTHIVTAQKTDVLRVPEQALRFAPGGFGARESAAQAATREAGEVWVEREGRLVRVPVTIGLRDDSHVEVTSGDLRPGDRVAVARGRGNAPAAPRPEATP